MRGKFLTLSIAVFSVQISAAWADTKKCELPLTKKDNIVHEDHYRWLESDSPERREWIFQQKAHSETKLDQMPSREAIRDFIWKLNEEAQDVQVADLGNDFEVALVDRGLRAPNEIVLRKKGREFKVLFSTSKVANDGSANLTKFYLDPKRQRILVPVTRNGSIDVADLHVVNIETAEHEEVLQEIGDYGITWISPNEFAYRKYADRDGIALTHVLGDKRQDRLASQDSREAENDPKNRYVYASKGEKTLIRPLDGTLVSTLEFKVDSVVAENDQFLYVSRIREDGWSEIIQVTKQVTATGQTAFVQSQVIEMPERGRFVASWAEKSTAFLTFRLGAEYWALVLDSRGLASHRITLPEGCSVTGFKLTSASQAEITLSSAIQRRKKFAFDVKSGKFAEENISEQMLTDDFGTRYTHTIIEAESKDKTKFPIRVTHRADMKLDQNNPALVEGYGGFGVPGYFDPAFNMMNYHFIRLGGVHVAPVLRGGNELGPKFRNDARLTGKQKTFDDMIATLEKIKALGYSNEDKIAAMGWSNGGLLIGALVTQRPDLLKVAIPGNGVQDMLRKREMDQRFADGWEYEYGSPDDPKLFTYLKGYSPVHNAKDGKYPIVLIIAGLVDSRVNVAHSFKLAAVLQSAQKGSNPVLLFTVPQAGHWASKASLQDLRAVETLTAIWTAIYDGLGLKFAEAAPKPTNTKVEER